MRKGIRSRTAIHSGFAFGTFVYLRDLERSSLVPQLPRLSRLLRLRSEASFAVVRKWQVPQRQPATTDCEMFSVAKEILKAPVVESALEDALRRRRTTKFVVRKEHRADTVGNQQHEPEDRITVRKGSTFSQRPRVVTGVLITA